MRRGSADDLATRVRDLGPAGRQATSTFLDALTSIEAYLAPGSKEKLPGLPDVGTEALRDAAARNEARLWRARAELYDTGLTREEAARRAGVKPNQITNLLRDHDLLSIDGPNGLRLPAWQFDPEAKRGRLDGIAQVAAAFPGGLLGLSSWIQEPAAELQGRTPRQALLDGDVDSVVAAAGAVGA